MSERLSVIIPIYKVEDYLDRCIESVVRQTAPDLEILLVDDGSPDRCPRICDDWAARDSRIQVIHKENGGLSSARNAGLARATGTYVLYVDSDDYLVPDACERLLACARGADLVVGEATIYKDGVPTHRVHTNLEENRVYTGPECAMREISVGEWFAAACYNLYRRQFLLDNGLFFVEGILHEDIEFLPRLFLAAKTVRYLHYEFYCYMIRSTSICGTKSPKNLHDLLDTYGKWAARNETIADPAVKKAYCGALTKFFMATCRDYHVGRRVYPAGMNGAYLLRHALNPKERLKALAFVVLRPVYVRL